MPFTLFVMNLLCKFYRTLILNLITAHLLSLKIGFEKVLDTIFFVLEHKIYSGVVNDNLLVINVYSFYYALPFLATNANISRPKIFTNPFIDRDA